MNAAARMKNVLQIKNIVAMLAASICAILLVGGIAWAFGANRRLGRVRELRHPGCLTRQPGRAFPRSPAGRPVNTGNPDRVIGNGTPTNCTSGAVVRAVAAGGVITFNCGQKPVTILMTATANVAKTERLVILDGGGLVTLNGGGKRRILFSDTCAGTWSTDDCVNQSYPQIVVQNITFETASTARTKPRPAWPKRRNAGMAE